MKLRKTAARSSLHRHLREAARQRIPGPAPRVSAVIPTYNRAALVTRAIESVVSQTFCDLELIVVDDASPDETPSAVARFDDTRLRYIRLPKNKGQWHAENVGIANARGEWVAFLDDDDEWMPDKIEKQLARAEETRAPVVYCRALRIREDGPVMPKRERRPLPEGDVSSIVLTPRMPSTPSAFLVRRDALLAARGFDEALAGAQDRDLWIRLALAGQYFVAVNETLITYHEDHPDRQMHDPVRIVRSTFVHTRHWGHLRRQAMGDEGYAHWREQREKLSRRQIGRHVRGIERSGSRSEAWRYVRRMTAVWPWGAVFYTRMLAVIAFGRLPYRVSQARKGKSGGPWLRRLLGPG